MDNYSAQFQIAFKAPSTGEPLYLVKILRKDYTGLTTSLLGMSGGLTINYANQSDHFSDAAIKPATATVSYFNTGAASMSLFYSESDETIAVEIFCQTTNENVFVGFLMQEDSQEDFTSVPYAVTLRFTDNLALLKTLTETDINFSPPTRSLLKYLELCIKATGLYLPVVSWLNTFEERQANKSVNLQNEPLSQTFINNNFFVNEDGEPLKMYETLEKILKGFNATLLQANGKWHIINYLEIYNYKGSVLGTFRGTEYTWINNNTNLEPTAAPSHPLAISTIIDNQQSNQVSINANAVRSIIRPFKQVKTKYNYNYRALIINRTLGTLRTLVSTGTANNVKTDIYAFPDYSGWAQINTGNGQPDTLLYKETNTITQAEIQRYIRIPSITRIASINQYFGFRFNAIDLVKGDIIDFGFKYRRDASTIGVRDFGVRPVFIPYSGTPQRYQMVNNSGELRWNQQNVAYPDFTSGNIPSLSFPDTSTGEWTDYDIITTEGASNENLPLIPDDGVLYLEIYGYNADSTAAAATYIKDINFTVKSTAINGSTNVIGQTHTTKNGITAKNNYEEEVFIDDSERRSLLGTLLINNGSPTNLWKQQFDANFRRLGAINTGQIARNRSIARTQIRLDVDDLVIQNRHVSLIEVFLLEAAFFRWFVLSEATFDLTMGRFSGVLQELFNETENPTAEYTFNYIYK